MSPRTARRRVKVRGICRADELYTVEGALRVLGLGRMALKEARASGMVKPYYRANRVFYSGREIQAWILSGPNTPPA